MATRPRSLIGKFVGVIDAAQERLKDATLAETIESLLERVEYKDHLVDGTEEGNDRWQNVQELVTKLHDYDNMEGEAALRGFLEEAALVQAADSLEASDAGAVTLITLHAAKGLEFPIVFIIGLEDGISPHSRAIGAEGTVEQLEEERRLLYVGVTRAEQRLFLVYAAERTLYGERREQMRSCFLDDVPPHLLTMSFSQIGGGSRQGERLLTQSRNTWGRGGSSSGYGSRGEAAARYRQPAAPFKPSSMPGRNGGAWPQTSRTPGGRQSRPGADTGISGERYEQLPGFDDLGVGVDDGPDFGVAAREQDTRTAARGQDFGVGGHRSDAAPLPSMPRPGSTTRPGQQPIPKSALREARFGRGERVKHLEYGAGVVIASSVVGSEELVLVRFDSRPDKPKNLSLSIHRLEPA
jgi:hypothetical protein